MYTAAQAQKKDLYSINYKHQNQSKTVVDTSQKNPVDNLTFANILSNDAYKDVSVDMIHVADLIG